MAKLTKYNKRKMPWQANKIDKVTQSMFLGDIPEPRRPKRGDRVKVTQFIGKSRRRVTLLDILDSGRTYQTRTRWQEWVGENKDE